ncbi:MAG: hypothetical protein R3359_11095 [Marinirhabdus sp.]|nr:hypothetical protein [Marinirhabdus sp.]
MVKNLFCVFVCLLLLSCSNSNTDEDSTTVIGGEIVNPKTNNVVLFKDDAVIDTIPLSEDNTFFYTLDNPKAGLYSFQHSEFQMFYLEPGDSLMLRLNTLDFDESLQYSGEGAKENNFLMDLFLQNENDAKALVNYYMLPPAEFQAKLDSIEKVNNKKYKAFLKKNDFSEGFKNVAQSNLDYYGYTKKEMYTSVFNKNEERVAQGNFPKDFYDYRDDIDFGNSKLRTYYPYYRFLDVYFDNVAYPLYKDELDPNRRSFIHNYNKIKLIDSLITNDSLKEKLIVRNMRRYLLHAKDPEKEKEMLAFFKTYVDDPKTINTMEQLASATMKLTPGQKIPNVVLVNTDNTANNLLSLLKKPTVLYFWSIESVKHFKEIHAKAAELASKYPEYQFIGINTDTHYKKWKKAVQASGYNESNEYQFEDIENAEHDLVLTSHNKAMVVSAEGTIWESNTNLFNPKIEQQLLGFLNN